MSSAHPIGSPSPLRAARAKAGLTQLQLAAAAGLSIQTVHLAERAGIVTDRTARALAEVLGVPAEELRP